jgi:hypothetical protein
MGWVDITGGGVGTGTCGEVGGGVGTGTWSFGEDGGGVGGAGILTGVIEIGLEGEPIGVVLIIVEMRLEESSKKSYEGVGLEGWDWNGKTVSSKVTCREIIILLVLRSRQR